MRSKTIVLTLVVLLTLSVTWNIYDYFRFHDAQKIYIQPKAPHAQTISNIIKPLRYTGINDLMNPKVYLSLNFKDRKWALNNIHNFDSSGKIVLHEGKYGLCGDLASYTYEQVKNLYDQKYKIDFMKVGEAGYFHSNNGSHIILRVIDTSLPQYHPDRMYFIDPSLRRYGNRDLFDQYTMIERYEPKEYLGSVNRDNVFDVGKGPPILITRDYMLSFNIRSVNGIFDRDNYRIALFAARKYGYLRPILFLIEKKEGKVTMTDSTHPITSEIDMQKVRQFKDRLIRLHQDLETRL